MIDKDYIAVVQCDIVMERCSGYFCEKAFHERAEGFSEYDKDKPYRILYLTCGGCCGRAVHRKLEDLLRMLKKKEGVAKDRVVVQLASCITRESYHGPACPHIDYLKDLIGEKLGLSIRHDTHISKVAEKRRQEGLYRS
jgi:predicted metal-binding protein